MSDAAIAVPILLLLAAPLLYYRMWRWVGLIALIATYEGLLAMLTDRTLSQEFWAVSLREPGSWTWRMVTLLALAWGGLLLHLSWKRLRKR